MTTRVNRDGQGPLVFEGARLAGVTTFKQEKLRWTELEIYRTDGGHYVTVVRGHSNVAGEVTRQQAQQHDTAGEAIRSFATTGRMSVPACNLLDAACENDDALATAFEDYEETAQYVD